MDGDTFEIALIVFDSLDASRKMIGITGHVAAMKMRIPEKILVEKGGGLEYSPRKPT